MKGVYSIAELVDSAHKNPNKTIFCLLLKDENDIFDDSQIRSLEAVAVMIQNLGAKFFKNLDDVAEYLNNN